MNMQTKLSAKGQVVIPKDVREELGWLQGNKLDVVKTANGVLLKKPIERKTITVEEASKRLRELIKWDGPPLPIEHLSWSAEVDAEFENRRK